MTLNSPSATTPYRKKPIIFNIEKVPLTNKLSIIGGWMIY